MSLARAWTRQLFGLSRAAVLVPGTVACAPAVLALAGGFARLGSIGQALSGPASPATVQASTGHGGSGSGGAGGVDKILPLGPRASPNRGASPNVPGLLPR